MSPICLRFRTLCIGVALLLALNSVPAEAAGCHSVCEPKFWPDCMGCSFVAFQRIMCIRASCGQCAEEYCFVAMPSQGDQWAAKTIRQEACTAPLAPVPTLKIVKVQRLAARS